MVKAVGQHHPALGQIDPEQWLNQLAQQRQASEMELIRHAYSLSLLSGEIHLTPTHETCLNQGIYIADILNHLNADGETVAAAIVYPCVLYADLHLEDIAEQLNSNIAKLVSGVAQMEAIHTLHMQSGHLSHNRSHIDNLRKMLLAMAEDVRVVLLKLAERTHIMRKLETLGNDKQLALASETHDIYAPLANRLGIGQLKWELEDLAFRYLNKATYKEIATKLEQKRVDRENYIQKILQILTEKLHEAGISNFKISGRAKHIYSIFRKMSRKDVDLKKIYDVIAVRVLVPTIEDCYASLSVAHSLWDHIPAEFDDYIAHPKPNGYRSLHTAVTGPENKDFEVQVRTYDMHQESELGVAAHWIYKEGGGARTSYDQKIAWLREILDWQKEVTTSEQEGKKVESKILEDQVYVFTPNGEIIDLAIGSTPLDFAYSIHTELGHRCRGAKINGHIMPLSYQLKTGDRLEILTTKYPSPSRDWLNPNLGYLKTSRAKAKVLHWFKKQDYDKNKLEGQQIYEREIKKLHLHPQNINAIVARFNKKSLDDFYASIGGGDLRIGQIIHAIEAQHHIETKENEPEILEITSKSSTEKYIPKEGISILGVGNLLTTVARCCRPVPGDIIVGYITQARGVSIHRKDCSNILSSKDKHKDRLIEVSWGEQSGTYPVEIDIVAYDRHGLVRDISGLLANDKINVTALNSAINKKEHTAHILMTVEVPNLNLLSRVFDRIQQLPNIISVKRLK